MQVQKINPTMTFTNYMPAKIEKNCEPKENCYTTNSIYSQNMSGLAFGGAARVRTCFEKEIMEQPKVIEKLAKKFFPKTGGINMDLNITPGQMAKVKRIIILASGSSRNAGEMARSYIESVTNLPVMVESASEFMDRKGQPLNRYEDLGIVISQSGKTADVLKALRQLSSKNVNTVAITNNPGSLIATTANSHISIDAGEENAVAATKTVTSSIYTLMALGLKLAELQEKGVNEDMIGNLRTIPNNIKEMLKDTQGVKKAASQIANAENIYYYAKNSNVGAVKEGALKLTETTGKRVIADSSTEALHGTFASIKPENPVLQVVAGDTWSDTLIDSSNDIREICKKRNIKSPIIIRECGYDKEYYHIDEIMKDFTPVYIIIPYSWESVTPIYTTVRLQQITNEVTKKLGINPDNGGGFLTKYRQKITM